MLKMFVIRDQKSESYRYPFFQCTTGLALRVFSSGVNEKGGEINRYPEDFSLFEIGQFEENTGVMTVHHQPIFVSAAVDFVKPDLRPDLPFDNTKSHAE